jgi:hypothetical protein
MRKFAHLKAGDPVHRHHFPDVTQMVRVWLRKFAHPAGKINWSKNCPIDF